MPIIVIHISSFYINIYENTIIKLRNVLFFLEPFPCKTTLDKSKEENVAIFRILEGIDTTFYGEISDLNSKPKGLGYTPLTIWASLPLLYNVH